MSIPICSILCHDGLIVETKVLKQLVRDIIQPDRDLGHSDNKGHKAKKEVESMTDTNGSTSTTTTPAAEEVKETGPEENATTEFIKTANQACEDCQ